MLMSPASKSKRDSLCGLLTLNLREQMEERHTKTEKDDKLSETHVLVHIFQDTCLAKTVGKNSLGAVFFLSTEATDRKLTVNNNI